uniref:DHC_N1 domain-containing protein n=1 Tax=Mesocestoides corti TaxID=53468 RepID=A0A5K3FIM4_MESCO
MSTQSRLEFLLTLSLVEKSVRQSFVRILISAEINVKNLLLALSSADFSSESNFPECRFGDITNQFIDACRCLDSWFIQKRLILTMKSPELQLVHKIRGYVSSINTIVEKLTDGVAYVPDL